MYTVLDEKCDLLAVKCVDLNGADDLTVQSYKNEIELLRRLQHSDCVVKLLDRCAECSAELCNSYALVL